MNHALLRKINMLLVPASQTNTATRTANLDTLNCDYAEIIVPMASAINTNAVAPTLKLLESNDTVASNFATWNSNFSLTGTNLPFVTGGDVVFKIDTRTRKRYIQVSLNTNTTTNDNVTAAVIGITSRLSAASPGVTNLVASTNDVCVVG